MYWPVRPVPADIARNWPIRLVRGRYGRYFFWYETGGVKHTGLLAGTIYSGRTGRYGTESITLV